MRLLAAGRPLRPTASLQELGITDGSTIEVLGRLRGGAPKDEPPEKKHRAQPRPDALASLRTFVAGPFQIWRARVPASELACDLARLVSRWSSAGVDVPATQSLIATSLDLTFDAALEVVWAWELIHGWIYDPAADSFSRPEAMDLDPSSSSPLDEVSRLRRELERVTQEASALRSQTSPPLTEANLLQLLAASPATPWVHALGEVLLHHLRSSPSEAPCPASPLASGVWATLQQFSRSPPCTATPVTLPQPSLTWPTQSLPPSQGLPQPLPGPSIARPSQGACFNCGLPGHWARQCTQPRPRGTASPSSARAAGLSILPGGQTVFTAASGRVYDVQSPPPYPCSRCGQLHWFFQTCSGGTGPPTAL